MSINLSDLTSPNNQDVLAEITSAADFLDPIGKLENLSRSPNKGGHALQTVALNQPRALPLIKNPQGKLGGYLYIPNVTGNYAEGPSVTIGANETWEAEVDMVITQFGSYIAPMGGGYWASGFGILTYSSGNIRVFSKGAYGNNVGLGVTFGTPFNLKYGYDGTELYVEKDGVRQNTGAPSSQSSSITHTLQLNQQTNLLSTGNYAIQKAKLTVNNAVVFDCDFNGSTSIRHGDTKFKCATNQIVTINQDSSSSNDVATIIKKPVLRFDGANSGLNGLFANNIDGGYMFAAFSVLGIGGQSNGRVFGVSATGSADYQTNGAIFGYNANGNLTAFNVAQHVGMFNDDNGDILLETKITNGSALSKVNNANAGTSSGFAIDSPHFNIATNAEVTNGFNAAIDLEYLALFPADSVPDEATATKIRNYINNRNNVFDLKDGFGYYFFDPQKADFTGNFTDANTLDGYITGSDNGDTDVRSNLTLEQSTLNDQPSTDGYTITFNDAAEHLEFENSASQNLSGWQICGTSLGTFAYRVDNDAVTELNLLGNLGSASFRKAGQSYGMILLPESATGADIESARKLLIDRGASESVTGSSVESFWISRSDIVEFSFGAVDIKNCTNFTSAWQGTTALQSFPAGAKLGTAATNVNFTDAWRSSGLTSFPALDLSTGTNFFAAWYDSQLTQFSENAKLGTNASNVNFGEAFITTDLTSFSTPLSNGSSFYKTWLACFSLTNFSYDVLKDWNPDSISNQVFHETWLYNTSLTAQSVENILTSIDASNQHGTDDGTSTGNPLGDSGIDIDYDGTTLSAATTAAVTSLKSKGWSIIVNNVTL